MKRGAVFGKVPTDAVHIREEARLAALEQLDFLDTPHDAALDRIARLITQVFNVERSVVSLIDSHRQWYMASEGMGFDEVARKETFCQHTIANGEPLVVRDASTDPRFADNPHVTARDGVRFYASVPLRTRNGQSVGTVCAIGNTPRMFTAAEEMILKDLTDLAMDFIELKQVATTDGLTGALNRRAFKEEGARAAAFAGRHRSDLAAVCLDLDHFKRINDTYGHAAGDQVLVAVANAVRSTLRSSDIFGRVGGEEFAIVLPQTDEEGARAVAEKLRQAVRALSFVFNGVPVTVTASFGIARLSLVARDLDALLINADIALYRAKSEGRDRCIVWEAIAEAGQSARRRVLKSGQILFNDRRSAFDCTVRSLGEDGAGLDVAMSAGIPERFMLLIKSDGLEAACRMVSRNERHVEVAFEG